MRQKLSVLGLCLAGLSRSSGLVAVAVAAVVAKGSNACRDASSTWLHWYLNAHAVLIRSMAPHPPKT